MATKARKSDTYRGARRLAAKAALRTLRKDRLDPEKPIGLSRSSLRVVWSRFRVHDRAYQGRVVSKKAA